MHNAQCDGWMRRVTEESGGEMDEKRVRAFSFAAHFVCKCIW